MHLVNRSRRAGLGVVLLKAVCQSQMTKNFGGRSYQNDLIVSRARKLVEHNQNRSSRLALLEGEERRQIWVRS